jgi:hypothetical protein
MAQMLEAPNWKAAPCTVQETSRAVEPDLVGPAPSNACRGIGQSRQACTLSSSDGSASKARAGWASGSGGLHGSVTSPAAAISDLLAGRATVPAARDLVCGNGTGQGLAAAAASSRNRARDAMATQVCWR